MTERQSRKQASSFQSEIIDVEAGAYYDDSEERLVKLSVANLIDAQRSQIMTLELYSEEFTRQFDSRDVNYDFPLII